ncbi:Na+/H+ antiporter subunit E [Sediminivirga luteola]|uniref:Sodium:proton antiporter n=1 Tax=Sediminivirga luteola TaxID=1774748 RepID=A0A8J2TZ15_9MICO|nr:Na+/H+ antiporter subunit E [Sediminivirga luteola]MCI2266726.1 Na+/H+ antiporter subunit E [Sediminivirga luteola]GGA18896.1 sodium:proton antiporter [Sediminivirga luteola]
MRLLTLPFRVVIFAFWFGWQIIVSAGVVLADILTPGLRHEPRVVRMPLESRTDFHTTVIACLITLTPGTLTLGVTTETDGRRTLLIHSMYHTDDASALTDLNDMERRMLRALTLGGA